MDLPGLCSLEPEKTNRIHEIILESNFAALEKLINSKANIEEKRGGRETPGDSPLLTAAGNEKFLDGLALLLQSGANVLAKSNLGYNALHKAAEVGNFKAIPLLAKYGVRVDEENRFGKSPIYTAIDRYTHVPKTKDAQLKTVQAFIDAKANVNVVQKSTGYTPLHEAARHNESSVIEILLHNGALREATDKSGKTALQIAKDNNRPESIRALIVTVTPEEIQHIIPFLIVLERQGQLPKEVHLLLSYHMVQDVVRDKLNKAKKYLPNYNEDELRKSIENAIIAALSKRPEIKN